MGLKIGVLALQGAFQEHIEACKLAAEKLGADLEVFEIRMQQDLNGIDGLIIPGGESTVMRRLLARSGLLHDLKRAKSDGLHIMGTCAGLICLADEIVSGRTPEEASIIGGLSVKISRNAYGTQLDSFKTSGLQTEPSTGLDGLQEAIFIRAPEIKDWNREKVKVLAWLGPNTPVAVSQGNLLGLAFHPELCKSNLSWHKYFLQSIINK